MNQQKIALLTDSCADLSAAHIGEDPIFVVPLVISWRGEEYEDGVDLCADQVFEMARQELPKTSLPRREAVYAALAQIRAAGYERVLAVMLSGGLSGTYNMLRLVAEEYTELELFVVDSVSASLGCGAKVLQLARYLSRGYSWDRMCLLAQRLVERTQVFLILDTLEYLQKGGRIGRVTALAGGLLNLKPIISFEKSGELGSVAKCRGARQARERTLALLQKARGDAKEYIFVTAYSGNPPEYPAFKAELRSHFPDCLWYTEGQLGSTLAVYTGPGLLGTGIIRLDGIED